MDEQCEKVVKKKGISRTYKFEEGARGIKSRKGFEKIERVSNSPSYNQTYIEREGQVEIGINAW